MSVLYALRPWLEPYEAADFLKNSLNTRVHGTDILRFGLDGLLELSIHLPSPVEAAVVKDGKKTPRRQKIEGTWTLLMVGEGKQEVECLYVQDSHRPCVPPSGRQGAWVSREGDVFELPPLEKSEAGLYAYRAYAMPHEAKVVVCMPALLVLRESLAAQLASTRVAKADSDDQLDVRERNTLYTVIAALAERGRVDISQPSKAAETLEKDTERLGRRVASRTIYEHLKAIGDLIDLKAKR